MATWFEERPTNPDEYFAWWMANRQSKQGRQRIEQGRQDQRLANHLELAADSEKYGISQEQANARIDATDAQKQRAMRLARPEGYNVKLKGALQRAANPVDKRAESIRMAKEKGAQVLAEEKAKNRAIAEDIRNNPKDMTVQQRNLARKGDEQFDRQVRYQEQIEAGPRGKPVSRGADDQLLEALGLPKEAPRSTQGDSTVTAANTAAGESTVTSDVPAPGYRYDPSKSLQDNMAAALEASKALNEDPVPPKKQPMDRWAHSLKKHIDGTVVNREQDGDNYVNARDIEQSDPETFADVTSIARSRVKEEKADFLARRKARADAITDPVQRQKRADRAQARDDRIMARRTGFAPGKGGDALENFVKSGAFLRLNPAQQANILRVYETDKAIKADADKTNIQGKQRLEEIAAQNQGSEKIQQMQGDQAVALANLTHGQQTKLKIEDKVTAKQLQDDLLANQNSIAEKDRELKREQIEAELKAAEIAAGVKNVTGVADVITAPTGRAVLARAIKDENQAKQLPAHLQLSRSNPELYGKAFDFNGNIMPANANVVMQQMINDPNHFEWDPFTFTAKKISPEFQQMIDAARDSITMQNAEAGNKKGGPEIARDFVKKYPGLGRTLILSFGGEKTNNWFIQDHYEHPDGSKTYIDGTEQRLYTPDKKVYLSSDNGKTWNQVKKPAQSVEAAVGGEGFEFGAGWGEAK